MRFRGLALVHPVLAVVMLFFIDPLAAQPGLRDSLALNKGLSDKGIAGGKIDTTLESTPKPVGGLWRRPLVRHEATSSIITREAYRYYASPVTYTQLTEESGLAYPLLLGNHGIGRESFLLTSRTSEPLLNTRANRALPLNDPLTGASMLNLFSLDAFQSFNLDQGARGLFQSGSDNAASDLTDLTIERFRSPLPFSRVHFTQVMPSFSNFDGVFSVNSSEAVNTSIGVFRRGLGGVQQGSRPDIDLWSGRAQFTYEHVSAIAADSAKGIPASKQKTFDMLVWFNYINAFAGMSGGVATPNDSIDVFDDQLVRAVYPNAYDHRARLDGLSQFEFYFLGDEPTRLSLYGTYSARRLFGRDSATPNYASDYGKATRYGAALEQPFYLRLGSFLTRAAVLGELQLLNKDASILPANSVTDTRLMAGLSDSLVLEGALGLNIYGAAKLVQSNVKFGLSDIESQVFPSIGLAAAIDISNWVKFTASYSYAKDWAVQSPAPTTQYILRNIGGYFDARLRLSRRDSLALHVGILDRNEPEGIVYHIASDSSLQPIFSDQNIHSQSALLKLDAYFSYFRWSTGVTYYPGAVPISRFTTQPQADVPLKLRFFGSTGLYYENEIAEGNLRMSAGVRLRYLNRLAPTLTYDPFADYYLYKGISVDQAGNVLKDVRLDQPKGMLDVLISMEIDRRAQVNMSFLNMLSTPLYNVEIYPRSGFQWRLDVTWAFLD